MACNCFEEAKEKVREATGAPPCNDTRCIYAY